MRASEEYLDMGCLREEAAAVALAAVAGEAPVAATAAADAEAIVMLRIDPAHDAFFIAALRLLLRKFLPR